MNDNVKKFHMDTLSRFNASLYDSLLYEHNITSANLKIVELQKPEDPNDIEKFKGYFALKDKLKYFIGVEDHQVLPIRIKKHQLWKHNEDVILQPTISATFSIVPEHSIPFKPLIDGFVPFEHTEPDYWTLEKIKTIMEFVGKTFGCTVSEPSFGKTSIRNVLHSLTNKCPVFKPRSVPGVLNKITGDGTIVFDEAHEAQKDTRDIMEEFTLCIAGGNTRYINGAMKTRNTKDRYDCSLQSITFLYNNVWCYKEPEKKYFEVIFSNNKAMDSRLLKMKMKGVLSQRFHRDFDINAVAEQNSDYYRAFVKELVYLQTYKQTGEYKKKFLNPNTLNLKGRKKIVYDEIVWGIDNYAQDQKEYDKFVNLLNTTIIDYKEMIMSYNLVTDRPSVQAEEERVEDE